MRGSAGKEKHRRDVETGPAHAAFPAMGLPAGTAGVQGVACDREKEEGGGILADGKRRFVADPLRRRPAKPRLAAGDKSEKVPTASELFHCVGPEGHDPTTFGL